MAEFKKAFKKELKMTQLDQVAGGYLNLPQTENGDYVCNCGGTIDKYSLVCGSCGASYGKSTPQENRWYE